MDFALETKCSELPANIKLLSLESILHQGLKNIKELVTEFQNLHIDLENYKNQFITQKTKCESQNCTSSESLKRIIETKDNIIQSVACALTKLNETKNFNNINEIFKLLCGETTLMTPIDSIEYLPQDNKTTIKREKLTPKKELSLTRDVSLKDDSVSEIESTPTGRTSPIILSKKIRSNAEVGDKKKCPNSWPTPEKKTIKLSFLTPTRTKSGNKQEGIGRLKQARFSLVKLRQPNVVDLTSSPEFSGGSRCVKSDEKYDIQAIIKKESFENDDTILPSPTSGLINFSTIRKNAIKSNADVKKPLSKDHIKTENKTKQFKENIKPMEDVTHLPDIEDSINLLQHLPKRYLLGEHAPSSISSSLSIRLSNSPKKQSPPHPKPHKAEVLTHFNTNASISLLQNTNKLEEMVNENVEKKSKSLWKSPLVENINITNVEAESSMSLLRCNQEVKTSIDDNPSRKSPEKLEQLYKEPTIRKKAEKRALPGWFCDECKPFYEHLYKDDPVMLAKKMAECSKHRGRTNPVRPKTPPGIWNPRWDVPDDTEEFNRRNNAN